MAKISKIVKSNRKAKYSAEELNRCNFCGRPRAYMRKFGLCRMCFKKLAHKGELPGITKASW